MVLTATIWILCDRYEVSSDMSYAPVQEPSTRFEHIFVVCVGAYSSLRSVDRVKIVSAASVSATRSTVSSINSTPKKSMKNSFLGLSNT